MSNDDQKLLTEVNLEDEQWDGGESGSRFTAFRQVAQRRHLASKRSACSELAVCQLLPMFAEGSGVLPDLRVVRHSNASLTPGLLQVQRDDTGQENVG